MCIRDRNVIRSADEKCRIKYELRDKRQFGGSLLCRNMKDGEYKFPFIIYREYAKNGDSISMANDGFEHPCTLSVIRGNGTILLKAVDMNARSGYDGKLMKGRIKGIYLIIVLTIIKVYVNFLLKIMTISWGSGAEYGEYVLSLIHISASLSATTWEGRTGQLRSHILLKKTNIL